MVMMYFPDGVEREVDGEGYRVLEPHTVRYWCRHTKELKGSQVLKAEQFVEFDCLHYVGNNRFICLPLNTQGDFQWGDRLLKKKPFVREYNSSEYLIEKQSDGTFTCNCQGFYTKEKRGEIIKNGANCSHILGLYFAFMLKKFTHPNQKLLVEDAHAIHVEM